jgi:hypothetical protein
MLSCINDCKTEIGYTPQTPPENPNNPPSPNGNPNFPDDFPGIPRRPDHPERADEEFLRGRRFGTGGFPSPLGDPEIEGSMRGEEDDYFQRHPELRRGYTDFDQHGDPLRYRSPYTVFNDPERAADRQYPSHNFPDMKRPEWPSHFQHDNEGLEERMKRLHEEHSARMQKLRDEFDERMRQNWGPDYPQ